MLEPPRPLATVTALLATTLAARQKAASSVSCRGRQAPCLGGRQASGTLPGWGAEDAALASRHLEDLAEAAALDAPRALAGERG